MTRGLVSRGFTLLEVLVVCGLIGLLAGALGLALREGNPALALQGGQGVVASLVAAARSQAMLHQRRTTLAIDADPASDGFLRHVFPVVERAVAGSGWDALDEGVVLPAGVFVVPPGDLSSGVIFSGGSGAWTQAMRSSLAAAVVGSVTDATGNAAGACLLLTPALEAAPVRSAGPGNQIVLTAGRRVTAGVVCDQPEAVRGIVLSTYGVPILINRRSDLDDAR
jgi:prepilin-type N-terminal cleavage/methylation domain-containing protein